MLGRIIRVLIGFALACLVAGVVKVAFVMTPAELAALPSDVAADRLANGGLWALAAATHHAVFSAPFALFATLVGEWRGWRSWTYYALVGMVIALAGFASQYNSEAGVQSSIANNYALTAFLTAGFFAGFVYWMVAGRSAGGHHLHSAPAARSPQTAMSSPRR